MISECGNLAASKAPYKKECHLEKKTYIYSVKTEIKERYPIIVGIQLD